jgi:hypothetical protein
MDPGQHRLRFARLASGMTAERLSRVIPEFAFERSEKGMSGIHSRAVAGYTYSSPRCLSALAIVKELTFACEA